jgi:hypothetical protein
MRLHGVGGHILLMDFAVGTERSTTVMFGIKFVVEDYFTGAALAGDAFVHQKIVEPKNDMMK